MRCTSGRQESIVRLALQEKRRSATATVRDLSCVQRLFRFVVWAVRGGEFTFHRPHGCSVSADPRWTGGPAAKAPMPKIAVDQVRHEIHQKMGESYSGRWVRRCLHELTYFGPIGELRLEFWRDARLGAQGLVAMHRRSDQTEERRVEPA